MKPYSNSALVTVLGKEVEPQAEPLKYKSGLTEAEQFLRDNPASYPVAANVHDSLVVDLLARLLVEYAPGREMPAEEHNTIMNRLLTLIQIARLKRGCP